MKKMTCEMCGSTDLVKQDGVFVCQSCGCKYSVEEAKKMMIEGTVKIDSSDELKNLYALARRAKESEDYENAAKYYEQILPDYLSELDATKLTKDGTKLSNNTIKLCQDGAELAENSIMKIAYTKQATFDTANTTVQTILIDGVPKYSIRLVMDTGKHFVESN